MMGEENLKPEQVADFMRDNSRYQELVIKKAYLDIETKKRKKNIQNLSLEVDTLSLKVEKAKLEEKWGIRRPGGKKDAAEETLRLCRQLEEDPDEMDDIIQELCIHQSKVTSQVNNLKTQLKGLANG